MRVLPITDNNISNKNTFRGYLQEKTGTLVLGIGKGFAESIADSSPSLKNFVLSQRIALVYNNLNTIMERFAHGAELSFIKLKNNCTHRFFIENPDSNYKYIASDIKLSEKYNKADDVERLENFTKSLSEINPFEINSKFLLQRKPDTAISSFEPDKNFVDIEDRLVIADNKELKGLSIEDTISYFKNLGGKNII